MPLFIMIGWDHPDRSDKRTQCREQHLAHVHQLAEQGRIVLGGPMRDDNDTRSTGSMIVFRADSLADARATVDRDPYVIGGVFKTVTVDPFKQVIPDPQ